MVTKYPEINQQPSPHVSQSPSYSPFTEQLRRAGYMGPELGRTQPELVGDHHRPQHFPLYPQHQLHSHPRPHLLSLSNPHLHPCHFPPPHSHEIHEAIQREIEKQQIREEIIMSEIARRRVLEAEVRRELMMERELALRGNDSPIGSSSLVMGFESPTRVPVLGIGAEGRSLEERIILSLAEKDMFNGRREGGFETSPFLRRSADLRITEGAKEKGKIILLSKADQDKSKRKAVTLPAGLDSNESPKEGGILKKKAKQEWSCAICQVSATSEQTLNEHLIGKKHKSKAAALTARKNYSIGLFPKKPQAQEAASESPPSLTENPKSDNLKKDPSVVVTEGQKNNGSKKNKSRFWCELCKVGSHSQKVLNIHKRGKKHTRRLEASKRNASDQKVIVLLNRERVDGDGKNVDEAMEGPEDREASDGVEPEGHVPVNDTKGDNVVAVDISKPADENLTEPADENLSSTKLADDNSTEPGEDSLTESADKNLMEPADDNMADPADDKLTKPADENSAEPDVGDECTDDDVTVS